MKSILKKARGLYESMSNTDKLILLITFAGIIIRLIYINATAYDVRQHDSVELTYNEGHLAYIWYWFDHVTLPDFDPRKLWQFYHPPLHHIIAAYWLKLNVMMGFGLMSAIENIQLLTAFYSMMVSYISYLIFKEIGIKGKGLVAAYAIVCLHPSLILMSGSINNDMLCMMLQMTVILYTVRWYRNPGMKKMIIVALLLGLSMMAKTSGALLAPAIAFVFMYRFVRTLITGIREKRFDTTIVLVKQYMVFIFISVPIGMWWSVYCLIRFGVPFGYVPRFSDTLDQYIGGYSVYERLFDMNPNQLTNVFENWGPPYYPCFEHNIIIAIVKTSLFGEYDFSDVTKAAILPAKLTFFMNVAMIIISIISMAYVFYKRRSENERVLKMFFSIAYITLLASFIKFCFLFPHTCTMDFRYIVPTMIIGALAIGDMIDDLEKKNTVLSRRIITIVLGIVFLFLLFGCWTYLKISLV